MDNIKVIMFTFLIIIIAIVIYSLFVKTIRPLIYYFEPIFFQLNKLLWFISNPIRFLWKNPNKGISRSFWVFLTWTGIITSWWVLIYILTIPIRLILAIYYDVILYITVSLTDNIEELINPKIGIIKYKKGFDYIFTYLITIPYRLIKFLFRSSFYIVDSFLMLGISIVFPTYTMYHGTSFSNAGSKISQSGKWYVGTGNHVGTGIYFGIEESTARHYAPSGDDMGIVISRVTLIFCKTVATMRKDHREMVGNGEALSQHTKGFFRSIEHWRNGSLGWWEYCILKPQKIGQFIKSWRLRPVAITKNSNITRLYGGFSHYSWHIPSITMGVLSWFIIFNYFSFLYSK